jgi:hypothetical protein
MCPQRMQRPDESFRPTRRWWIPTVNDASGQRMPVGPRASDWYVVVDEMVEGRVRLVVAAWPQLDRGGRLYFGDLGRRRGPYASRSLQALIDRHRARQGQVQRRFGWAMRSWYGGIPAGWVGGSTSWTSRVGRGRWPRSRWLGR